MTNKDESAEKPGKDYYNNYYGMPKKPCEAKPLDPAVWGEKSSEKQGMSAEDAFLEIRGYQTNEEVSITIVSILLEEYAAIRVAEKDKEIEDLNIRITNMASLKGLGQLAELQKEVERLNGLNERLHTNYNLRHNNYKHLLDQYQSLQSLCKDMGGLIEAFLNFGGKRHLENAYQRYTDHIAAQQPNIRNDEKI